ncbi:MAG: hypothetical protein ACUVTY_08915 [Armatimonadota bacterium]
MFTSKLTLLRTAVLVVSLAVGYYSIRVVQADPPCNQKLPLCEEGCTVTVFPPPIGSIPSDLVPTHQVYGPGTTLYECGRRRAYQGRTWCTGSPTHEFVVLQQGCRNERLPQVQPPPPGDIP